MYSSSIGISTLAVGRRGLDIVGQNIANAATPGYHRQALNIVSRTENGVDGTGVDVASITRYEAPPIRTAIVRANAEAGASAARLDAARQLEVSLGTSPGTIADAVEGFFNAVGQLTARPDNTAARRSVLSAADTLAGRFRAVAGDADRLRQDVGRQVVQTVEEVNEFATRIAELNQKIAGIEGSGQQANDLRDQRDRIVNDLSQRMDVQAVAQPFGVVNVIASGVPIVVGEFFTTLAVGADTAGNLTVTQTGSTQSLAIAGGTLGGRLQAYNDDLPTFRTNLDDLARGLMAQLNAVQATGLGTTGPVASLTAGLSVADPAAPLATQALAAAPSAGTLSFSLTAGASRTNVGIAFDPATQSLNDLAAAITAGTGGVVTASVDPATNVLSLTAAPGSTFDFAGRAPTTPVGAPAVADADTGGLLPALGLNGLFRGTGASSMAVRPDILANPALLAGSRSGLPGDGTNLERFAAARDVPLAGGQTAAAAYADLAAAVGAGVRQLDDRQAAQASVLAALTAQEQSATGVDINEELVSLLDYQRMVESGAKYLSVVNEALDAIIQMVR